jgi:selenocysteine-specific elongation factor
VRVRSVQVHDEPAERAAAGQRVALALVGVERAQVRRGHVVATSGSLAESFRLDCDLRVLASSPRGLRNGEPVMVHHGTAEIAARVAIRGGGELAPGAGGKVQLRLRTRTVAAAGDHVVVRLTGPAITVAGGTVTDPSPPRVRRLVPTAAVLPQRVRAPMPPPSDVEELYGRLAATPLTPPAIGPPEERAVVHLVETGRAVRAGRDLAFTIEAIATAQAAVVELASAGGTVTLAQLRDRLGISRKFAQALLEALDARGITRRVGDERVLRRRALGPTDRG